MIDYVLMPTIQHTGTWFLIDVLQKAGMTTIPYNPEWTEKNTVLYMHYPLSIGNGILPQEEIKFISLYGLNWAVDNFKKSAVVIPLRDPLLALLTRQQRHPQMPHKYIIDGFISFAKEFQEFNVLWFPVDLYVNFSDRLKQLKKLEKHIERSIIFINTIASEWQQKNTQGMYPLKEAYLEGDTEEIKKAIPYEWKYLTESREILQPFFLKTGYKNLLWFED